MLSAPFVVLCLFAFSLGLSYLLAAAYVFFGDIQHLYTVALTLWMYLSAIFYPADQLNGFIRAVIGMNPLYLFIHTLRQAVMAGQWPDGGQVVQMALWGGGVFLLGFWFFRKNRGRILQKL